MHARWKPEPLLQPHESPPVVIEQNEAQAGPRILVTLSNLTVLTIRLGLLKLSGRLDAHHAGSLIAHFFARMGMLWVKLGQLLSMRTDLFPARFCDAMARLQDKVTGFPTQNAIGVIEAEIGQPLDEVFEAFEQQPIAAASIAQVYRARLRETGEMVAIKVRRPKVKRIFASDLRIIRVLFHGLHQINFMAGVRWPDFLWELEHVFSEELDYHHELANQRLLRKRLARHGIYVPHTYDRYCGAHVLVMEFIEGVSMAEYIKVANEDPERLATWVETNHIDPEEVGRKLLFSYLRQLFEDNCFHADLHPGNLMLLRNNGLVFLDFGCLGYTEGDALRKYFLYLEALSTGQYAKAADVFLLLIPDLPAVNITPVKEELLRVLQTWGNRCRVPELPYKMKSATSVTDDMTRILTRHGITVLWSFFKLLRGWTTMDASLVVLMPHADLAEMMRRYMKQRQRRMLGKVVRDTPFYLLRLQKLIDLPREYAEMSIYKGAMVRRLAQVFEGTSSKVSRLLSGLFRLAAFGAGGIALLSLAIAFRQHVPIWPETVPVLHVDTVDSLPHLDIQIWVLLLVLQGHGTRLLYRLASRFSDDDTPGPGLA